MDASKLDGLTAWRLDGLTGLVAYWFSCKGRHCSSYRVCANVSTTVERRSLPKDATMSLNTWRGEKHWPHEALWSRSFGDKDMYSKVCTLMHRPGCLASVSFKACFIHAFWWGLKHRGYIYSSKLIERLICLYIGWPLHHVKEAPKAPGCRWCYSNTRWGYPRSKNLAWP